MPISFSSRRKPWVERSASRIKHYSGQLPVFENFSVQKQIDDAFHRQVWLPCGGYIVIDETEAMIRIMDNGIGLPADRARLFEPYVTTREKGTGLGLPIVKKIIEEHGGTLTLEDAPVFETNSHSGAMAVIRLPRAPRKRLGKNTGPLGQGEI